MSFLAYRGFDLVKVTFEPRLAPLTMISAPGDAWSGIVTTADRLPDEINRHGLYGYKSIEFLMRNAPSVYMRVGVIARVELFGRIVEHELGYRAEKAIISKIWLRTIIEITDFHKMNKLYVPVVFHYLPSYSGLQMGKLTPKRLDFICERLSNRYDCPVERVQLGEEIEDHEAR